MLIGLGFIVLWRRTRNLKERLRELTDEEVQDFVHGNQTFEPNDPHAPIFNLPYNQKYEILREDLKLGIRFASLFNTHNKV